MDSYDNSVVLVKYDNEWKNYYILEKHQLLKLVGKYILNIEHVGSTSIKGLSAKPIIDIMIVVTDLKMALNFSDILEKNGYYFRHDSGVDGEYFINKKENNIDYYIHVVEKESGRYNNFILFRDYLNTHPNESLKYKSLKERLALDFKNDRKSYTLSKGKYIEKVIMLAKSAKK